MGMGPESTETIIVEIGGILLALGMALIMRGMVGALVAQRQYGAASYWRLWRFAGVERLIRLVASFSLLLIGYTWLMAWWRASQQWSDLSFPLTL